jgi:hypothetical protein
MWGLGQDTLLGIVVDLWASGNTLYWGLLWFMCLGQYFTGLCGASGNTLCIVVGYVVPRTTHVTASGYCCGLCEVLGNTLYWASSGLLWGAFINGFKIILFKNNSRKVEVSSVSVFPPKLLERISPHKQNHGTAFLFPN